tara:strand:- start:79 stop:468 length:390 start_codon:yes stop_codon:yes gene_type:complete
MKIIKKGSKLYSVLFNRCPECHNGNFWCSNNPFKNMFLSSKKEIKKCLSCSLVYELELGFWYGAMYISYAIGVAIMLFFWGLTVSLFPLVDVFYEMLIVVLAISFLSPLNYHYSRLIWINIFVKYKDES